MQSIKKSILFTRSAVGIGSKEHDLIGEDKINSLTSTFDNFLNTERAFPLYVLCIVCEAKLFLSMVNTMNVYFSSLPFPTHCTFEAGA